MVTISLDLRQRILATYDEGRDTREDVAQRFRVSLGFVKKLLGQRRRLHGDIAPQHHRSGPKPKLQESHRRRLAALVAEKPDRTLAELRAKLKLACTIQTVHYALQALDLTYKKRVFTPASKTAPTWRGRARRGAGAKAAGIRRA